MSIKTALNFYGNKSAIKKFSKKLGISCCWSCSAELKVWHSSAALRWQRYRWYHYQN